jgi:hypothetical protein
MQLNDFLNEFPATFNSEIKRMTGKVFQVSGQVSCLFYIKERKSTNQNWGVTKNVHDKLKKQNRPWILLLLSASPPSYFLTSDNVEYYIKNRWTLNKDGDYKTSPTFPEENEFATLGQFKSKIEQFISPQTEELFEDENNDVISTTEGGEKVVVSRLAERNPKLRTEAIKIHGLLCKVCGFDFEKTYGLWGQDFIEVHHISPLGQSKSTKVQTDPEKDLTVLCSNCHRMVHRKRGTTLTLDELKNKIKSGA